MTSYRRVRAPLVRTAVVAALAFSLGSASIALGLVVNGVVFACYHNASGVLRVELPERPCNTSAANPFLRETRINLAEAAAAAAEAAARAAADTTLQSNINAETAARTAANAALQQNIDNESAARAAADSALQANIDGEATARAAADNALQQTINNEAAARIAADSTLQANVDSEAAARAAGDTAAISSANAYTNSKLTSPNGLFAISVTDAGIVMSGPSGNVTVGAANLVLRSGGSQVTVNPSSVAIVAPVITLNGGCGGVAYGGVVSINGTSTLVPVGPVLMQMVAVSGGTIPSSTTVLTC